MAKIVTKLANLKTNMPIQNLADIYDLSTVKSNVQITCERWSN